VRPSAAKNADGSLKPFYLKRAFKYLPSDRFELEIINSADPYGAGRSRASRSAAHAVAGPHSIAPGAQKVDFIADESYEVTPLRGGFADVLKQGRNDRVRAMGRQRIPEHLRQELRSLRLKEGRLHGIRPRLSQRICCSGGRAISTAAASTPNRTAPPTCRSR